MSTIRHSDMIRKRAKKPEADGVSQSTFSKAATKALRKRETVKKNFNYGFGGPRHD